MMKDAVLAFPSQFAFEPKIIGKKIKKYPRYILAGMGGSHLAADLLLSYRPDLPLTIHNDYGLPTLPTKELKNNLLIASSYSGNTEETIDALEQALKKKMPAIIITVGGNLIDIAKKKKLPYIQLPNTGIQPRSALGFSLRAILKILGDTRGLAQSKRLAKTLNPVAAETAGRQLAESLKDRIPVIYASRTNAGIAYNWKIKLNETGKIPAFYNLFPELNHNEANGFDVRNSSKHLSDRFHFLFLTDDADHPRVQKRMQILKKLYEERGLPVTSLALTGKTVFEKIFSSLLLADWAAISTAELYGLESEQVPMIEEFKKLMA